MPDLPPLLYVAGPYRAPTRELVEQNIQSARRVGLAAAELGWSPVIPHTNTAHFDEALPDMPDGFWLDATMALLLNCDAMMLCPGWRESEGTCYEIAAARNAGIPIYASVSEIPEPTKEITDEV